MGGESSLRYLIPILFFAIGIIGMLAAFAILGPLYGIVVFWAVMGVCGYALYRLLRQN